MNDLRLIILLLGLVLIAGIYFWEIINQRIRQRRQAISPAVETDLTGIRISSKSDSEDDYSAVISDLNAFLAQSKKQEDEIVAGMLSVKLREAPEPAHTGDRGRQGVGGDVSRSEKTAPSGPAPPPASAAQTGTVEVIVIHIMAPEGTSFNGGKLLEAAAEAGLEFGKMDIFHHFGTGRHRAEQPLFSLVDMFEPGKFDPRTIRSHQTRGLSLFFCLPDAAAPQTVFDLLLDTARKMATRLGGELHAPDHALLDDSHIADLRNTISLQAS